jgi:hypothetical protein
MTKARDIADFKFENITDTGTEGTRVAVGTSAQRGTTQGQLRFNTTTGLAEYYTGTEFKAIDTPPTITSVDVTNVETDLGGTQTFVITGSLFGSGATVKFRDNGGTLITSDSTTFNSGSQLTVTKTRSSFSNANEPYDIIVTNPSGLEATLDDAINVDNTPAFNTASGTLATITDLSTGTHATVSATDSDSDTLSYTVSSGSLPAGLSLNSSTGVISGDPTDVVSQTTSTFDITATGSNLSSSRSFNIIVNPAPDGTSSLRAGTSADAIKTLTGTTTSGVYWITVGGTPRQIYCDMSGYNSSGYMLMATMKDMQSGWSGSGSVATATNNINSYTNWGYDSNWWTSSTGEADIVSADYDFTQNRDYKSWLWSNYQVNNSSNNGIYLVNGNALGTTAKQIQVGGSFSSSTLVNVFNGTTTVNADRANSSAVGDGWNFNGGSGTSTSHSGGASSKNINVSRSNWNSCYMRIGGYSSGDTVLYGSSISSGAGLKHVRTGGSDTGAYPSSNYTQNSNYTTGISMTLWVK